MSPSELIDIYCSAWCEPDAAARTALLDPIWADGATYTDPSVELHGATELVSHIDTVLARRPGSRVVRTTDVDVHHNTARFGWQVITADGARLPEGIDIAYFNEDATRIERILGFFGPMTSIARHSA